MPWLAILALAGADVPPAAAAARAQARIVQPARVVAGRVETRGPVQVQIRARPGLRLVEFQ